MNKECQNVETDSGNGKTVETLNCSENSDGNNLSRINDSMTRTETIEGKVIKLKKVFAPEYIPLESFDPKCIIGMGIKLNSGKNGIKIFFSSKS